MTDGGLDHAGGQPRAVSGRPQAAGPVCSVDAGTDMANTPRKIKDPTEAALSAIQDALKLRDDLEANDAAAGEAGDAVEHRGDRRSRPSRAVPALGDELFEARAAAEDGSQPELEPAAANDDRQSVGEMLHLLQRGPSRGAYVAAVLFSIAWIAAGCAVVMAFGVDSLPLGQGLGLQAYGLFAALILPIVCFFILAYLVRRTQELRIIARTMAEAAMRLSEPDTLAKESIVTVGQAIRREVAAMGDGVERALARAAELEALVHNEVAALERAYNDNELRVRGLIEDLAGQRDALVDQAEQVRNAISGVHVNLTQDITSVSEMVASSIDDAAQRITRSLAEKGEHITLALGRAGDSMVDAIGERGGDMLDQLNRTGEDVTRTLEHATERLASSMSVKTDSISEEFGSLANKLSDMMASRLDQVAETFQGRTTGLTTDMVDKAQRISEVLVDTSARLAETIATRADEVNSTLKATGESLVLDLTLRGSDIVGKLEETGGRITDSIVTRTGNVTETFRATADSLATAIDVKGDAVKEMLSSQLQSFQEMLTRAGAELADKIARDSGGLGDLMKQNLTEFDRTVRVHGGELLNRIDQHASGLEGALQSHLGN
ncbi:MAG: hypothetical protein JO204_18145, partial [Alphaproteobacteria bacterium]|nr:hypothetical protein [Alphaproteobacteria bacterium]